METKRRKVEQSTDPRAGGWSTEAIIALVSVFIMVFCSIIGLLCKAQFKTRRTRHTTRKHDGM